MTSAHSDAQATGDSARYRALLAVSEAIVSHRDLSALFHALAGRLHQVVRFDYLGLALHEATSNTMRIHLLEGAEPTPLPSPPVLPLEEEPAGWVWQTQQAWIFSNVPEEKRWPRALERAQRYGVRSSCHLPLTTARRRLGILVFACKQPYAYETADVSYLQAKNQLTTFANLTGGYAWFPRFQAQMPDIFNSVAAYLRSQYTIGFNPTTPQDGKYHKLKVEALDDQGNPLTFEDKKGKKKKTIVHARAGYTAMAPGAAD